MVTVSVITPARNAGPFLRQAIASVQAQTIAEWELLIVDDGSTDDSRAIAAAAARADRRVRPLSTRSRVGAAAARNLGLANARGEFVAFLDADDLFEPDKLGMELAAMSAHPSAAMVYGPTLWWWPDQTRAPWLESMTPFAGRLHRPPELFVRVLLEQAGEVPCTCAVLVRRAALAAVGGFEEAFSLYEDQTLWAKLMLRWPVYVHAGLTSRYRQHAASASAAAVRDGLYHPSDPHASRADFLLWAAREAETAGRTEPRVRRAVRLALAAYPDRRPPLTTLDRSVLLTRGLAAQAGRLRRRLNRWRPAASTGG